MALIKQKLETWLQQVNYDRLNSADYVPSEFSLVFMNMIKLINGAQGESHKTPPFHLEMLDKAIAPEEYVANLCFRGSAKTTVFMEYFTLILAILGYLPGLGDVDGFIYVSDSMDNGVKSARKNIEERYNRSEFCKHWLPKATFTDNYLEFENRDGHKLGVKMFGAKTGIRGTKIFGKRPKLCVLDDLISDDDSKSKASMQAIKDTVYKGVNFALDPNFRKVIFNGTPFGKDDIIVEAVESGAWKVNVYPVCERFPCTREEFKGAWSDRFNYDAVMRQYQLCLETGKLAAFYQELMLQLTSDDERLIQDGEILWYQRKRLLENKGNFNFYITTDFATSTRQTADFSVISVWAYNAAGHWFWVDGICARQTIDLTWNDLFRLVSEYGPQQVGIEVTGQQQAYIKLLQNEMMNRNIWFNFATSGKNNTELGIRPVADKLTRLNMVVPWFKAGRMYFPEEMKQSVIMGQFMEQLRLATKNGLKGKDDCLDTISMLGYLTPWKPSEAALPVSRHEGPFEEDTPDHDVSPLNSYCV